MNLQSIREQLEKLFCMTFTDGKWLEYDCIEYHNKKTGKSINIHLYTRKESGEQRIALDYQYNNGNGGQYVSYNNMEDVIAAIDKWGFERRTDESDDYTQLSLF